MIEIFILKSIENFTFESVSQINIIKHNANADTNEYFNDRIIKFNLAV
jgi:hypothetical protein